MFIKDLITCPISGEIMTKPYIGSDGQTYQLENIISCLDLKEESPMNRQPMTKESLRLNVSIKYLCDQYAKGEIKLDNMIHKKSEDATIKLKGDITYISPDTEKAIISLNCENISFDTIRDGPGKDIVIVIDISGSTSNLISAKDTEGNEIEAGYSINDVLKHSANSIIASMRPQDRVSFIVFNHVSNIVFDFIEMSELNKVQATEMINMSTKPSGMTNIWDGCDKAISIIQNREDKDRNPHILLLTDGVPTMSPARGEYHKINSVYKDMDYSIPIYGCGFGYNLKKDLLYNMCSKVTHASVHHICDGSMIATVFNNIIGLIMNTASIDTKIYIQLRNSKFQDPPIMGDLQYQLNEQRNELIIMIGSVQFEQTRDVVLNITDDVEVDSLSEIIYSYSYVIGNNQYMSEQTVLPIKMKNNHSNHNYELFRSYVCNQLVKLLQPGNDRFSRRNIYQEVNSYYNNNGLNDGKSNALIDTWKEQMYLCIGSDEIEHINYYNIWGNWYCEQFLCSLSKQYTPNFKDKSGDAFKSKLFNEMVDICSDAFDNVTPPEPCYGSTLIDNKPRQNSSFSMSQYNNINGGCLTGETHIRMADNSIKQLREIKAGDLIYSQKDVREQSTKVTARVIQVIETKYNRTIDIVNIGKHFGITNWHPIFNKIVNKWEFPKESDNVKCERCQLYCESVYTLLLDQGHILFAGEDNIPAITLASNQEEGILKHPYFSTDLVIRDLRNLPEWATGHIILYPEMYKRTGPIDHKYNTPTVNKISL